MRPGVALVSRRRRRSGAGGGAVTVASDTFTRADNTSVIGNAEVGGAWTALIGALSSWGISSNQAYSAAGANNITIYQSTTASDCTVSITLSVWSGQMGLWCRITDASNFIRLLEAGGTIFLEKIVAGVSSTLGSTAIVLASGDTLSLVMSGNSIVAKRNGTTIITASDAFNATATKHGFGWSAGSLTGRFDNFLVTVP